MDHHAADRQVGTISTSLNRCRIDLVVSGSIAAVESFSLIRSLRKLGATVQVYLSPGAELFVTKQALEWASDQAVITSFASLSPHLATADMCVVAPSSASFMAKVALGIGEHPAAILVQSYMGAKQPVMILPCMHDTLFDSPANLAHLQALKQAGVIVLEPRHDDGKQKFPQPLMLARTISHHYHHRSHSIHHRARRVVMSMGSTRGYIDPVRYITARSSGELATILTHELYCHGFKVHVVCGDAVVMPESYNSMTIAPAYQSMTTALADLLAAAPAHLILAAAASDYLPQDPATSKIASAQPSLQINFTPTTKMRTVLATADGYAKICFKQSIRMLNTNTRLKTWHAMQHQDGVTTLVFNALEHMDRHQNRYQAHIMQAHSEIPHHVTSKIELASYIVATIMAKPNIH